MRRALPPLLLIILLFLSAHGSEGDDEQPPIRWDLVESLSLYDPMQWRAARTEAERRQSFAEEAMERARDMKTRPDRRSSIDGSLISNEAVRERGKQAFEEAEQEIREAVATLETLGNLRDYIQGKIKESDFMVLQDQEGREVEAAIYARDGDVLTILSRQLRPFRISLDSLIEDHRETIRSGRVPMVARRLDFVPPSFFEAVAVERMTVVENYDPSHRFLEVARTRPSPIDLEEDLPGFLRELPRQEATVADLWDGADFALGTPYHRAFSRIRDMARDSGSVKQDFVDGGRLGYLILERPASLLVLVFDDGELRGIFLDGLDGEDDSLPGTPLRFTKTQKKDALESENLNLAIYRDALALIANDGESASSTRIFSQTHLESFFSNQAFSDLLGRAKSFFADPEEFPEGVLLEAPVFPSGEWFEDARITDPFEELTAVVLLKYLQDRYPPKAESDVRVGWRHFFWTTTNNLGVELFLRDGKAEIRLGPVE